MDNREVAFAARHFAVVEGSGARSLDRAGQFCRATSEHNAVANISEREASEGGAFVLHWPGLPGPDAAETTVGLRVVKNARKHKAPIANVKTQITSFILAPMHFPFRAEGAAQLKRQLAFRGQLDFRQCSRLRAPAP
jgi:hypothetical protein